MPYGVLKSHIDLQQTFLSFLSFCTAFGDKFKLGQSTKNKFFFQVTNLIFSQILTYVRMYTVLNLRQVK